LFVNTVPKLGYFRHPFFINATFVAVKILRIGFMILLVAAQLTVAAQNYYEPVPKIFEGGLVAGCNFTQIDGDSFYGYHKVGLDAGGVVYVHFTPVFGASMEIAYSQKGSRGEQVTQSPSIGTYVAKYFMNVNYVEVPFMLHVKFDELDFEAGVSYDRLISSNEWILSDQQVTIDPVANRFNTSDIDYILGLSHKVYKQFYLDARFLYSITSIRPADRIPVGYGYGAQGQYNNMLSVRVMYLFK